MHFNKKELMANASMPSQRFYKEGVLIVKEKPERFFRRVETNVERWFRLRGNLLYYLRGPEQWSEPLGVIVLEQFTLRMPNQDKDGTWPFQIVWEGAVCYKMATTSESERKAWVEAIQSASYEVVRSKMTQLQERRDNYLSQEIDLRTWRAERNHVFDLNEVPLCEMSLSCDNLLCDMHGRQPTPLVIVSVQVEHGKWVQYASTELVVKSSNPTFFRTIMFYGSDGLNGKTLVRMSVYDVKELVTHTQLLMGSATLELSTIQDTQRLRIALKKGDSSPGFLTVSGWSLAPPDTMSPSRSRGHISHRRSQSLPPKLGVHFRLPSHAGCLKDGLTQHTRVTYRFHSGLGGDISVHEIMSEFKAGINIPIQLLDIFIQHEKELLQEVLGLGELDEVWKARQFELVDTLLSTLKHYSHARQSLQAVRDEGRYFKESTKKGDPNLEFAPVNLHLQHMWVNNDTLNKSGFYDCVTVGAFTAHAQRAGRESGLYKLVQDIQTQLTQTEAMATNRARVISANEAVESIRTLRSQLVHQMSLLIQFAELKQSRRMRVTVDRIFSMSRALFGLWDAGLIKEALEFMDDHKIVPPQGNLAGATIRKRPTELSRFQLLTEELSKIDLKSPQLEDFASPPSQQLKSFPNRDQPSTSQAVDKSTNETLIFHDNHFYEAEAYDNLDQFSTLRFHADDNSEESSTGNPKDSTRTEVMNKMSKQIDLRQSDSESDDNLLFRLSLEDHDEQEVPVQAEKEVQFSLTKTDSPSANYYQPFDEPEPHDMMTLKLESTLMWLRNVVNSLTTGKPASSMEQVRTISKVLPPDGRSKPKSPEPTEARAVKKVPSKSQPVPSNKSPEGIKWSEMTDWASVLRPTLRKLRETVDGILKTERLAHAMLMLTCETEQHSRMIAEVKIRRDVCLSQALTAVANGLHCWLWTSDPDVIVQLMSTRLGPVVVLEGLLSLYEAEKAMWGDMVVAAEDVQSVGYKIVRCTESSQPIVTGSKRNMVVNLPVSDELYNRFSDGQHSFAITTAFFNVGVNEKAILAQSVGNTAVQEASNRDSFEKLYIYYLKYIKLFPSKVARGSVANPLEEVMENFRTALYQDVAKNVAILQLADTAARMMNGVRVTSCKSAKDRTGMSCTLQQCMILTKEYNLPDHEFSKALDCMRRVGCRRENTFKNTGVHKYAFSKLQVGHLPNKYRPPLGTFGSSQT